MKDKKSLTMIMTAFKRKYDRFLADIAIINAKITQKKETIAKFTCYQNEYIHGEEFSSSRSLPTLDKNLYEFIDQLKNLQLPNKLS